MLLHGEKAVYNVGSKIAETAMYRLYVAKEGSKDVLLRISTGTGGNGDLEREDFLLKHLARMSAEYEDEYARTKSGAGRLNYTWLFPTSADSFISKEQGGRRVNILTLEGAKISQVAPLTKFKAQEKVDVKTTIWVLGRLLKLQGFVNEVGIGYGFSENEVLIGPKNHNVIYLGWLDARFEENPDPRPSIKAAARSILEWGAPNGTEGETEYFTYLKTLASQGHRSTLDAFHDLYALAAELWGERKYHPYTTVTVV